MLVGEFTTCLALLALRQRHSARYTGEAEKYQELSMEALKAGDRPAYKAANQLANEAFGKSFFMQVAMSATFSCGRSSSPWPGCRTVSRG